MHRFYLSLFLLITCFVMPLTAQVASNDSIIEKPVDSDSLQITSELPEDFQEEVDSSVLEIVPEEKIVLVNFDTMVYLRKSESGLNIDDLDKCHIYFDKIILKTGDSLVVRVNRVTPADVVFFYPFSKKVNYLSRSEVYKVQKSSGKELLSNNLPYITEVVTVDSTGETQVLTRKLKDWQTIVVTEDEDDVEGMTPLENVTIRYEASYPGVNAKYLKKNAIIRLQRRVANIPATKALITNIKYYMPYGDIPSVEIEAIPYTDE